MKTKSRKYVLASSLLAVGLWVVTDRQPAVQSHSGLAASTVQFSRANYSVLEAGDAAFIKVTLTAESASATPLGKK